MVVVVATGSQLVTDHAVIKITANDHPNFLKFCHDPIHCDEINGSVVSARGNLTVNIVNSKRTMCSRKDLQGKFPGNRLSKAMRLNNIKGQCLVAFKPVIPRMAYNFFH
jgi:hypothetical protein